VEYSGAKWRSSQAGPVFLGEYEHSIDDKSRLTLPAKFREAFADGGVVTRGMDGCLMVFAKELEGLDPFSAEARQLSRFIFSGAADAEPDRQGRIALPAALVNHAKLGKEVVVAGVRDHVEIWDRASWRAHLEQVEGSAERVAERLAAQRG
jgi:MraZ protein